MGLLLVVRDYLGVGLEGDLRRGVAKLGFRDLCVLPIRDQQRGRGSAQNMHNLFIGL